MLGKGVNQIHHPIFNKAFSFIRDNGKVPNNVLRGIFSVSGAFEWMMCKYKIIDRNSYQCGHTVDVLGDN